MAHLRPLVCHSSAITINVSDQPPLSDELNTTLMIPRCTLLFCADKPDLHPKTVQMPKYGGTAKGQPNDLLDPQE